jgi:hypothetical protein
MRIPSLFPHLRGCRVDDVRVSDGAITLTHDHQVVAARVRHPHVWMRRRSGLNDQHRLAQAW